MRLVTLIFYLVIIVVGVIFAWLNAEQVTINYYLGVSKFPLSLLLIGLFASGVCLGLAIGFVASLKLKLENRRLKKNIDLTKQEVTKLRMLSINGS